MTRKQLVADARRVEQICCETANSREHKYMYWLAVAVYHILCHMEKQMAKEKRNETGNNQQR